MFSQLKGNDGSWKTLGEGLETLIIDYFAGLFASLETDQEEVLNLINMRILEEQNRILLESFQPDEIKAVVFAMHSDKSRGPDDMNPAFLQRF